jgi:hypothetical protein
VSYGSTSSDSDSDSDSDLGELLKRNTYRKKPMQKKAEKERQYWW